ncbi:MAG: response regulator [Dehalococcoidia bacterium]|nr:response regulator [Dehalococcoidia bacterium]
MTDAISIVIADDHGMVRQGLRNFLSLHDDFEVTGEAADAAEAVALVGTLVPDIVLMDLVMPVKDGVEATREIKVLSPSTRVIILTSFAEDEQVFAAIKAGAWGYLLKDVRAEELARAIRGVHSGEPMLHPQVARTLMREMRTPRREESGQRLTERETDVLLCLARGMSNKEIATELVISEKTVKTHVSNILQKLHLADRTQAALYAVEKKLTQDRR